MRRWTGFRPSRTSGSARETMTDIEYSRKERSISSWISMGSMNPEVSSSVPDPTAPSLSRPGILCPYLHHWNLHHWSCLVTTGADRATPLSGTDPVVRSDVEEAHILGIGLNELATEIHVLAH